VRASSLWSLVAFGLMGRPPPISTLFPYTTLFRSKLSESSDLDQETVEDVKWLSYRQHFFSSILASNKHFQQAEISSKNLVEDERSEEHTSELQSRENLVCRLLLEKKNKTEPSPTQ